MRGDHPHSASRRRLEHLREVSPVSFAMERLFYFMQRVSPERLFLPSRMQIQEAFAQQLDRQAASRRRGRRIEAYLVGWLILEAILVGLQVATGPGPWQYGYVALAVIRIFDIFQTTVNTSIFDRFRVIFKDDYQEAVPRQLILSVLNYLELIACFGIIYGCAFSLGWFRHNVAIASNAPAFFDAFYFSAVTQLTVGYGDIAPVGPARLVSAFQGLFGFLFTLLILSRMVTLLPDIKSED